ncbi:MAG: phenylalanine--tRNA ligase subunit beta [Bacteroidetes bacterium B1(2017)]|nr:MAG: phenylalanine--tRNA ligase subunit beta [Bacteroidetes bacterium B1(2017)]
MKISYEWLKDFIDTTAKAEEIGALLTGCGLEVEDITPYNSIPGGLEGILIGEVLSAEKHPNADKLRVCQVNLGSVQKQIVCGAPNVAAGQKVLVATVGCTVHPSKGEPFTINKAKIRGEVSEGMICAEDELSLGESHDGILVLPDTYEVGKPASDYFPVYQDQILEIGLTANRGDATSHYGVARDLYALGVKKRRTVLPRLILGQAENPYVVTLQKDSGCLRYSGLEINNISVKPSPEWLQNRLKAIGLSPINNIVDATNYIMHSIGQPLHAFDATEIAGHQINVRTAKEAERMVTLDNVERRMKGHECLICDAVRPLAIAGVFGGLHSGISAETKNIFIESAYFDSATVRKSAKAHGLNTDASFRFERGTDPNITFEALHDVAALILDIAGGYLPSQIVDIYPNPIEDRTIHFNPKKSNELIGKDIALETQKKILTDLQILIHENSVTDWELTVPPYRVDIERPIDITEEILRIYGLNNIEMGTEIKSAMTFSKDEFALNLKNKLANYLSSTGFFEMASNSLTRSSNYTEEQLKNAVTLLNPLSQDLDIMRIDMLHSVLEAVQFNNNRKSNDLRFFEIAKTYSRAGEANSLSSYTEQKHLVLAVLGRKQPESWNNAKTEFSYFGLKAVLEQVFKRAGLNQLSMSFEADERFEDATQILIKKKVVAVFGSVNSKLCKKYDLDKGLLYADINLDVLTTLAQDVKFKLKPVSVFPSVRRDLALLLDESISYQQLEKIAAKTEPNLLKQMGAFDVYTGDKIEQGKKSYALSFVLQDDTKTLTDQEIEEVMQKLISNFTKEAGAVLRG